MTNIMHKTIYHGSEQIIQTPLLSSGKLSNDFGRGFYCTESPSLAGEWACKNGANGFINQYSLDLTGLNVCYLNSQEYHILNWLAILTRYRGYWQQKSIAEQAKNYLQEHYFVDLSGFDIVIGYRADDSYFSFVQDFITGVISLQKLSTAMRLGKLGEQIVLKSEKAFQQIQYQTHDLAFKDEYYSRKTARDLKARREYHDAKNAVDYEHDIFIIDILRGRVNEDDLRI